LAAAQICAVDRQRGRLANSTDSTRIQGVNVDICGLIRKFSRTLHLEELLKRSLPSIYRSWHHQGPSVRFEILKRQQAMQTQSKCPVINRALAQASFVEVKGTK
jgi:hypothetical protein